MNIIRFALAVIFTVSGLMMIDQTIDNQSVYPAPVDWFATLTAQPYVAPILPTKTPTPTHNPLNTPTRTPKPTQPATRP